MRLALVTAAMLAATPAALAQEISVPSVATASPGGYANPLKLDTDRYKRGQKGQVRSSPAKSGRCNNKPLTPQARAALEEGYRARASNGRDQWGYEWLRDQCGPTSAIQIQRTARRRAAQ